MLARMPPTLLCPFRFSKPASFASLYICGKVFKWLKGKGGLEAMKAYNEKKAGILYDFLDGSSLFHGTVRREDRSLMNVPFVIFLHTPVDQPVFCHIHRLGEETAGHIRHQGLSLDGDS